MAMRDLSLVSELVMAMAAKTTMITTITRLGKTRLVDVKLR